MSKLYTGHEAEMGYEAEIAAAWATKPRAERQIDMMRSRLDSALETIKSIGTENLFGETVTADAAAEAAMHYIAEAIRLASLQK